MIQILFGCFQTPLPARLFMSQKYSYDNLRNQSETNLQRNQTNQKEIICMPTYNYLLHRLNIHLVIPPWGRSGFESRLANVLVFCSAFSDCILSSSSWTGWFKSEANSSLSLPRCPEAVASISLGSSVDFKMVISCCTFSNWVEGNYPSQVDTCWLLWVDRG